MNQNVLLRLASDIYDQAEIHFDMVVPADLDERAEGKVSVTMLVDMTVALRKDSKVIDFNVKVDNKDYPTDYVYYLTARSFQHLIMQTSSLD
ncbi:MAG: hypothetical protein ACLS54_08815 [Anaerostipes hadrus]